MCVGEGLNERMRADEPTGDAETMIGSTVVQISAYWLPEVCRSISHLASGGPMEQALRAEPDTEIHTV